MRHGGVGVYVVVGNAYKLVSGGVCVSECRCLYVEVDNGNASSAVGSDMGPHFCGSIIYNVTCINYDYHVFKFNFV